MKETPQEYIQRMLGNVQGQDPLKTQAATAKKLERLVKGVPTSKLRKRPAPDKWSVAEILAHLADTEIVGSWRIRSILGAPGTPIQAFDQDVWAKVGRYRKLDAHKCLEMFCILREHNLTLLRSLKPRQWRMYGMHAERGKETFRRCVTLIAGHDFNHLNQIRAIRKQFHC